MNFKNFLEEEKNKQTTFHKMFVSSKKSRDPNYHKLYISSKKRKKRKQVDEKFDWAQQASSHDYSQKGSKNIVQSPFKGASPKDVKDNVLTHAHWNVQEKTHPLHPSERNAVYKYTGNEHHNLNSNLFKGKPHGPETAHLDKHLSGAISKRTAPKNFTVFSGMRSPENLEKHKGSGHILITNPAYTSTSAAAGVGKDFGGTYTHDRQLSKHTYWRPNISGKKSRYKSGSQFNPNKHKGWKAPNEGASHIYPEHKDMPSHVKAIGDHSSWTKHEHGGYWHSYKHVVQIHVPKDSHGIYTGAHSEYTNEKEYVLHKDAKIAVHPKPEVDHENGVVKWKGKLVHDGVKPTRHGENMGLFSKKEKKPEQKSFDFGPNKNPSVNPGKEKLISQKKSLKSNIRKKKVQSLMSKYYDSNKTSTGGSV